MKMKNYEVIIDTQEAICEGFEQNLIRDDESKKIIDSDVILTLRIPSTGIVSDGIQEDALSKKLSSVKATINILADKEIIQG
ncbi:hypothetical protein MZV44_003023 [Listeria monocytogenes]|nr:hypothetical protein [Listeria monocytogenes]EJC6460092.1 hypothetical protein [Listeria monocytogenes]EJT8453026.1 hypothetical protein [Listeria monocytogenes]